MPSKQKNYNSISLKINNIFWFFTVDLIIKLIISSKGLVQI